MYFQIQSKGKWHYFRTETEAKAVANEIFQQTGVIVGIERKGKPTDEFQFSLEQRAKMEDLY